jgi:hypothetical protein
MPLLITSGLKYLRIYNFNIKCRHIRNLNDNRRATDDRLKPHIKTWKCSQMWHLMQLLYLICTMCVKWQGYVYLSVRMFQFENRWTDFDEIWYGRYANRGYPKIVLFKFLQYIIPTWRKHELVKWKRHYRLSVCCSQLLESDRTSFIFKIYPNFFKYVWDICVSMYSVTLGLVL